jgi:hypothetical protein
LFGYDFILDENHKAWLIEINTNPGIDETTPHLAMIFPRMINDLFKLTLDLIYPRPYNWQPGNAVEQFKMNSKLDYYKYVNLQGQGRYPVVKYADNQNMWQFLG